MLTAAFLTAVGGGTTCVSVSTAGERVWPSCRVAADTGLTLRAFALIEGVFVYSRNAAVNSAKFKVR